MSSSLSGINPVDHSRLLEELKELKSKLTEAEEEIEYKKEELELALTDNRFLREELAQKESVIKGKDVLNENLQKRNTELQRERERLQSRYLQLQRERKNDRQKNNENVRGDLAKLQSQLEECQLSQSSSQLALKEMELKINDADALLERRQKSQEFLRQRTRDFQQENDRIQWQLSHMKEELKAMEELRSKLVVAEEDNDLRNEIKEKDSKLEESEVHYKNLQESEKLLRLSNMDKEKNNLQTLTSRVFVRDCSKFQSEVKLEELTLKVQSLIKRVTNEIIPPKRDFRKINLDRMVNEYNQNVKRLRANGILYSTAISIAVVRKYSRICKENDVKIKAYMKKLFDMQTYIERLTEMLKNNNDDTSNMELSLHEKLKEFEELNVTSFTGEFEEESFRRSNERIGTANFSSLSFRNSNTPRTVSKKTKPSSIN